MAEVGPGLQFRCVSRCTVCCVIRDYPRISAIRDQATGRPIPIDPVMLGKEGMVEVEDWELPKLTKLARKLRSRMDESGKPIKYTFLPARGMSRRGASGPETVLSYWLMGRNDDGDMCPFLSTPEENQRTEDGTLKCLIYEERPLQCRAYPVHAYFTDRLTGEKVVQLDEGCQWVMEKEMQRDARVVGTIPANSIRGLDYGSFARLRTGRKLDPRSMIQWAFPTGVYGEGEKPEHPLKGWVVIDW